MEQVKLSQVKEWEHPSEGTQDIFLEEMEVLLRKYYGADWKYDWKGQEDSIELELRFPNDKDNE